jgi:GNAT superfamily N-acetyltransferase
MMATDLKPLARLKQSSAQPAAETLARAFQNYPLFKHYYPDYARRTRIVRYSSSIIVHIGFHFGEVYATPNFEGIAVWVRSARYKIGLWPLLLTVPLDTLAGAAVAGALRMRASDEYAEHVRRRLVPCDHWYLLFLGVDPQFQGRGYASRLIRSMLARTDSEKTPCYLETHDKADVPIYLHFGFKIVEDGIIPNTTLRYWAMFREVGGITA